MLITDAEFDMMSAFVSVLSGFEQATSVLSGQQYETASLIIPIFYTVRGTLNRDDHDSNNISILKAALRNSFDFYMKKYGYFENKLLCCLTFLDPRLVNSM